MQTYVEANTRFLLMNNNWTGLIMDGTDENIKKVHQQDIYWKYNLKAVTAGLQPFDAQKRYVQSQFRESRDKHAT